MKNQLLDPQTCKGTRSMTAAEIAETKAVVAAVPADELQAPGAVPPVQMTPAFKSWFGKSQVVNEDWTPRVVYHGSRSPWLTSFDLQCEGTGCVSKAKDGAIWFTSERDNATWFANYKDKFEADEDNPIAYGRPGEYYAAVAAVAESEDGETEHIFDVGPFPTYEMAKEEATKEARLYNASLNLDTFVTAAYLKIQNPLVDNVVTRAQEFDAARKGGHDGIIAKGVFDGPVESDIFVVFSPTQIKSATRNSGTYSDTNSIIAAREEFVYWQDRTPEDRLARTQNWVERSGLPTDAQGRARLYHATPKPTALIIEKEGLRQDSYLATDAETALHQAGRDRGLKAGKLVCFECWVPMDSFRPSVFCQLDRALTPEEMSMKPIKAPSVVVASTDVHYYHDSDVMNRESIMKHGLSTEFALAAHDGIFFHTKLTQESRYTDVWEADLTGYDVEPDETTDIADNPEYEGDSWWVVWQTIPPERLKLVKSGKMHTATADPDVEARLKQILKKPWKKQTEEERLFVAKHDPRQMSLLEPKEAYLYKDYENEEYSHLFKVIVEEQGLDIENINGVDSAVLKQPTTLHHATTPDRINGIFKKGLEPRGRYTVRSGKEPKLFLGTEDTCAHYVSGDSVVLAVTIPAGTRIYDNNFEPDEIYIKDKIPAAMIKKAAQEGTGFRKLWHGGRITGPIDIQAPTKGRYEAGPGLYLTTSYQRACKYAKGGGSTFLVTVKDNLNFADDVLIPLAEGIQFAMKRLGGKGKDIAADLRANCTRMNKDMFTASTLINLVVNYEAGAGAKGKALLQFLQDHNVDAASESPSMGFQNEQWVVVFNPKAVLKVEKVPASAVTSEMYNLPKIAKVADDEAKVMAIVKEYMKYIAPGLPLPVIQVVNTLKKRWLGRCEYTPLLDVNNTVIKIQKSIINDDNTLRRVVAHELCHHDWNLTYWKLLNPRTARLLQKAHSDFGHGEEWLKRAAVFNAEFGANFITPKSDESYVQDENTKQFYVLVTNMFRGNLTYATSVKLSPKQRNRAESQVNAGAGKLFLTTDDNYLKRGTPIGQGWAYPQGEEMKAQLQKLWDEGTPVAVPGAKAPKAPDPNKEFFVCLRDAHNMRYFAWSASMTPLQKAQLEKRMTDPWKVVKTNDTDFKTKKIGVGWDSAFLRWGDMAVKWQKLWDTAPVIMSGNLDVDQSWEHGRGKKGAFDINRVEVREDSYGSGTFCAYIGKRRIGYVTVFPSGLTDEEKERKETHVWKSYVKPMYRRKGVAQKLYTVAKEWCAGRGWRLMPTENCLSDEATAFWNKFDPETVKNNDLWWRSQYVGRQVELDGRTYNITSVVGKYPKLNFVGEDPQTNTTNWLKGSVVFPQLGEPEPNPNRDIQVPMSKEGSTDVPDIRLQPALEAIYQKFPANPENPKERVFFAQGKPALFFEVDEREGRLRLRGIRSVEPNSGVGSIVLKRIINIADQHGVTVELTASPYGEGDRISGDKLKDWYKSHGFEEEEGHDPALGYMVRKAAAMTRTYYHATSSKRLNRIATQGLLPSKEPQWGGDLGNTSIGKVFLADTPKDAMFYARILFGERVQNTGRSGIPLCLRIMLPPEIKVEVGNGEYWTTQPIPPQHIEIWWQEKWSKLTTGEWNEFMVSLDEEEGEYVDWEGASLGNLQSALTEVESFTMPKTANPQPKGQVPPAPGSQPIPPRTVRLWHYTRPENLDSIRASGLDASKARGDDLSGTGPSAGIWASTRQPSTSDLRNHPYVEFWATVDQISHRADYPDKYKKNEATGQYEKMDEISQEMLDEWAKGYHHVIIG